MKIKKILGFLSVGLLALLNFSCEDVIDLTVNDADAALVIEGNVTNVNTTQTVKISKSVSISDKSKFNGVSGAVVTITDSENRIYILSEQPQSPGVYVNSNMRGRPLLTYFLKVINGGKEYKATSVMPAVVKLDSLGIVTTVFFNEKSQSVEAIYQDPLGTTNYYRFLLTINNVLSKNIYTNSDKFNDGKVATAELGDLDKDIEINDVVKVEMQCIDQNIYRYFEGLDQNENRGGASTTPANPVSNISNGALGYFSAHTVQTGTVKLN